MANIETGKLICELRKVKNMTQKDLANYLNVSDKAVSKWERGESYPEVTILPQLASILEITVDELLGGKRQDVVPEGENEQEKYYAYVCLLEDAGNRFFQNTVISFLVIVIGILVSAVGYRYSVLVAAAIGIGGAVFYCFALNKYRTSQERIQRYWEFKRQKDEIYYRVKHSKLLIGITIILLFVDIITELIGFKAMNNITYNINRKNLYIDYWCSYIGYLIILTAIIANLYVYYVINDKNMSQKLLNCQNKIKLTTFISSLISLGLFYGIVIFKIIYIVMDKYNENIVNIISLVMAVSAVGINILLFKKYYKDRTNVFWGGLTSGIIQFGILIYISNSSIFYYNSYSNPNLGTIGVYMLVIAAAICTITIYYVSNYLLLKNEAGKNQKTGCNIDKP